MRTNKRKHATRSTKRRENRLSCRGPRLKTSSNVSVAIGNPERDVRKASHRGSKQQ